ncbi:MAG: hypothetical protein JNK82_06135 [Myxococcaceae bacterium]|nr:hypothetical protein [Myxococcaceae bacterium]
MPPIKGLAPVTTPKPRADTTPAVRIDQLVERLVTHDGVKLGDALFARITPSLAAEGQLDPHQPLQNPPKGKLEKALVFALQELFINAFHARKSLPGAVANVLLPFTSKKGDVDVAAVKREYGPEFAAWVQKLGAIPADAPGKPIADRLTWDSIVDYHRDQIVGAIDGIAPRLEAVDFTVKRFGEPGELEGFKFFGLQHLFATSARLFEAVVGLGVEPKDCRLIGKNYSTNWRVAAELEAKGMTVDGVSRSVGNRDFTKAMNESIHQQLADLIGTLPKPVRTVHDGNGKRYEWAEPPKPMVLLIDDGAEAIRTLHEDFPEWAPFFACVEQTRRGARIAHELADKGELKCAVVNVAESWAKLERESPMIGQSVVAEVTRKLDRFEKAGVAKPKEATIIGYGAVGKAVAQALLERGIEVHVYDRDASRLKDLPAGMVACANKAEALTHGAVTVSCVGSRTLQPEDWDWLPDGAMLVNAASADDELGPQDLLKYSKRVVTIDRQGESWGVFQGQPVSLGHPSAEAHSDSIVRLESGKELLLASNGFVVNMTGERDPIPPRYIQLTRALLLMGALTATRATKTGLIDVPEDWQKALVAHIEGQLSQSGESLQKPLWDAVIEGAPPPPPAEVIAAARREREQAEAEKTGVAAPARPQAGTVTGHAHGYTLGPAAHRTFAWDVAEVMGLPDHDLTVEAAALFHASRATNTALGMHLTVKFNPDVPGRPTTQKLLGVGDGVKVDDEKAFEVHFGLHSAGVAYSALLKQLGRAPTVDQIAEAMVKIAHEGDVSLGPYHQYLLNSPDAENSALGAALTRALDA